MVLAGGVIGSVMLLIVVIGGISFFKKNQSLGLYNSLFARVMFWISTVSILLVSGYGILKLF